MNFKEIITATRAYNFHSHTQFCDGRADMARFVQAAVSEGIKHYGFTPHSPIPLESACNMEFEKVNDYLAEFERLKEQYRGEIQLYSGMEIDFLGDMWGASHSYFNDIPLDYKISSIHFIPTADGSKLIDVDGRPEPFMEKMKKYFDNDIHYVVNTFFRQTNRMIEQGGFDIIGHFDKIGSNADYFQPGIEDEKWYKELLEETIHAIIRSGLIVEINTKAWLPPVNSTEAEIKTYKPRLFPSENTIRSLHSEGVTMLVNSDTHFPDRISAGREAAFEILDSF